VEDGLTMRVAGLAATLVGVPRSDHVTLHGPVPVSAAEIVVELPAQIVALPVTVAVGNALTVITALPDEVPGQPAPVTAVTVYVVVVVGLTLRVAGLLVIPFCVTPSDQVTFHGAVPVSAAVSVVELPTQMLVVPLTVAVGNGLTVTIALPEEVPVQFASETTVTVYVVVADGVTLRVAGLLVTPVCVTASDHVMFHGPVPVSVAVSVVELPAQMVAVPVTVAVGNALTVITALPEVVPAQPAPVTAVTVYVVVVVGFTLRVAGLLVTPSCWMPSDQVTFHGEIPVSVAVSVVELPTQIVAVPVTVAVGNGMTVTTALPEEVPVQFASETAVTVYVVVTEGFALRVAGLLVMPLCVRPSDQVMLHGMVPVSAAERIVELPTQMVAVPLTVAVGNGLTVTTALPVMPAGIAVQFASESAVTVYVVVVVGFTLRVAGLLVMPSCWTPSDQVRFHG